MMLRRSALLMAGAGLLALLLPAGADASVARALSLVELVSISEHVVVGTPLSAESHWESSGDQRRIVTYTQVRIDETLDSQGDPGGEVWVRTLGGQVDGIGQVVHGEAVLAIGERSVLFVGPGESGAYQVSAMAQGQYPLKADDQGTLRLTLSPGLAKLLHPEGSAVRLLHGSTVGDAGERVRKARQDAH